MSYSFYKFDSRIYRHKIKETILIYYFPKYRADLIILLYYRSISKNILQGNIFRLTVYN